MTVEVVNKRTFHSAQVVTPGGTCIAAKKDTESGEVITSALLLYTGKKEEIGDFDIDDGLLSDIFEGTKQLQQTRRIKLYNDHTRKQSESVGVIEGELTMRSIAESDLPGYGDFSYLVGRKGIFAGGVRITNSKAVEQYNDGTAREVSVGLMVLQDTEAESAGMVIAELSLVGMNALAGAHLKGITKNFTISDVEQAQQAEEERQEEVWEADSLFYHAKRNIERAADEDIPEGETRESLMSALIDDYAERLREALVPVPEPEPADKTVGGTTDMDFLKSAITANEDGTVVLDMEKLATTEVEESDQQAYKSVLKLGRNAVRDAKPTDKQLADRKELDDLRTQTSYQADIRRGEQLVTAKKMPPAIFKHLFGNPKDADKSLERYSDEESHGEVSAVLKAFELLPEGAFPKSIQRDDVDGSEGGGSAGDGMEDYTKSFLERRKKRASNAKQRA